MFNVKFTKSFARFVAISLVVGSLLAVSLPAIAAGDPGACKASDFSQTRVNRNGTAHGKNISDGNCTVGLASFIIPDPGNPGDQTLFDNVSDDVRSGNVVDFEVRVPTGADCPEGGRFQIDFYAGNFPGGPDFSAEHLIGAVFGSCGGGGGGNPAPTADIKANNQDGPITIAQNAAANLTWTSTNTASCTVTPGNFTGTTGSHTTGNLTASQTYTLQCTGTNGQSVSDTVTVNVQINNQCTPATVTTSAATNVTTNSATLNATVNPNGHSTNVYFEYGTTQSLGTTVGTQTINGTNPVTFSAQLTNLQPNTVYYFRVVASNECGSGVINGSVLTFTTTNNGGATPTADIKANGQDGLLTVQYNTAATITWTSLNTVSCQVSPTGWTGTSGTQSSGNITGTITYVLNCTGTNGQNVSDNVVVQATGNTNNQLPTVTLFANPTTITLGQNSVLTWNSNNANYCYASAGPWSGTKSLSGSETVTPSITSTYTITCSNSYGSASATATVFVNNNGSNNSLQVTKLVRNITLNQTVFSQNVEAQGLDVLEFEIRVRNTDNIGRTITVQDILPQELFYVTGSTTVNGSTVNDGITTNGLNLGFMNPGEERVVRFRTVVFAGTTNRTITNQANANGVNGSANANVFGNAYATVQIVNRGQVLGVSDIVTGPDNSLMIAIVIGLLLAAAIFAAGKRFGWFNLPPVRRAKRSIEEVLFELREKAQASQLN